MFNFCSLYSGSSGNSLFIQSENTNILVDAGESARKIENALSSINVDAKNLNAILVTHEHIDHVKSLGTLAKKYNIPVYATKETWEAMPDQAEKIDPSLQNTYVASEEFKIGNLTIKPFSISHDAANPCGFSISHGKKQMSIATDLGYVSKEVSDALEKSSFVLLESNYDPEILKFSRYPYPLKRRISGEFGHLSNGDAAKLVVQLAKKNLNTVMLGHLSKENNFPELAYKTVADELINAKIDSSSINLSVASRNKPSNIINIK
ncbi:MAG: MBL fold metallo-hydrolase [Clostridia bacterium]|nr:MBL fold metallo-hydrolase [Clostridia bacterium]